MKLDLQTFRSLNVTRAVEGFKTYHNVPITYWTTAIAGEAGELCNMIKKLERVKQGGIDGGSSYTAATIDKKMLAEEIGGIFIYLDLIASVLDISLEDAVIDTFNSKSQKYGFSQFISEIPEDTKLLVKELRDNEISFDLFHSACMRATTIFRSKHPEFNSLTYPDTANMIEWLCNRVMELEQSEVARKYTADFNREEVKRLTGELAEMNSELGRIKDDRDQLFQQLQEFDKR